MKAIAIIEKGTGGTYDVRTDDTTPVDYMVLGQGDTVKEAIEDFNICYEDIKQLYLDQDREFIELEFDFKYDTASLLNYYSTVFSMPALERLTGINQKQLHHYAMGISRPREVTKNKIEKALHNLGKELVAVRL